MFPHHTQHVVFANYKTLLGQFPLHFTVAIGLTAFYENVLDQLKPLQFLEPLNLIFAAVPLPTVIIRFFQP